MPIIFCGQWIFTSDKRNVQSTNNNYLNSYAHSFLEFDSKIKKLIHFTYIRKWIILDLSFEFLFCQAKMLSALDIEFMKILQSNLHNRIEIEMWIDSLSIEQIRAQTFSVIFFSCTWQWQKWPFEGVFKHSNSISNYISLGLRAHFVLFLLIVLYALIAMSHFQMKFRARIWLTSKHIEICYKWVNTFNLRNELTL